MSVKVVHEMSNKEKMLFSFFYSSCSNQEE